LSKSVESVAIPLVTDNLLKPVQVQVKLSVSTDSGASYDIDAGSATLGTKGIEHLSLPLGTLKVFGTGTVDLSLSSPQFDKGEFSIPRWAKLDRPLVLSVQGKGVVGNLDIDLAQALSKGCVFDSLLVGEILRMKFAKLPAELKDSTLQVGIQLAGKTRSAVDVGSSDWSQPLSFGLAGDTLDADLVDSSGKIDAALVIHPKEKDQKRKDTSQDLSIPVAQNVPVPVLSEFKLVRGGLSSLALAGTGVSAFLQGKPVWNAVAKFQNVHPHSSFSLDLVAIYSGDGTQGSFELLQFKSSDLMGQNVSPTSNISQWTYQARFQGGVANIHLVADFQRLDPTSPIDQNRYMGLVLCQAKREEKAKGAVLLTFSAQPLSRLAIGSEILARKIVPEKASAVAQQRAASNGLGSNLLNVVDGVTTWTKYPKTLDDVLDLQMKLHGNGAPSVSEGVPASRSDTRASLDPSTRWKDPALKFQFVRIDQTFTVSDDKLEEWLAQRATNVPKDKKWHLRGTARTFNQAARDNGLNVAYCLGHCIAETGGTAMAFDVGGKTYYNAFGIGAFDGDSLKGASGTAHAQGWDTPQKAIAGGLQWIAKVFMKKSGIPLNTPYKLRWNPDSPATNQYCTAIGWCDNIARTALQIANNANQAESAKLVFDFPYYADQDKPS
jgi:beta-N-acetylglucosaminidase